MKDDLPIDLAELDKADAKTNPLFVFDHWGVNLFVPPLLVGLAWLVNHSPFNFLLAGFQVWMHEFGHATAAWLCGRRATPLPFGWTPVEPEYASFVYWGLLLLFAILFIAGWKERKIWPMLAALVLAVLQFYFTWRMAAGRQEFWWGAFGGVGGEFYLSALVMAAFYIRLPEKFKWGQCRYVCFFLAASVLLHSTSTWNEIYHGREDIPLGSMIHGEDDDNGDMNKLMADYHWTEKDIRRNYQLLGYACWGGLGLIYFIFACRFNVIADRLLASSGFWTNADMD